MKYRLIVTLIIVGAQILLQACSVDGYDQTDSSLSTEESLITGQIVGESISENQSGLLSSFSEAFAITTPSGLTDGPSAIVTGSFRNIENYTYSFDPETGDHSATFTKQSISEGISTQTDYSLNYRFLDSDGETLEFPNNQNEEIEAVDFRAVRNGEIETSSKRSIYTRTDRLFIDGISESADILSIDGYHSGEGLFTQIRMDGTQLEREYILDLNYLNIQINKPVVLRNRNFRSGVNGAFSYENTIRQTNNGSDGQETKIVNGTVELNGDGTALLKFREQFDTFRLRLANGEVFDEDEFEGRVTKVDIEDQIFTIANGQRIQINEQTEIDVEDFRTLEEVALAVENGVRVTAEGDYVHPDENVNLWIATEVEFELESNEFEGLVASVNLTENTFTLVNGDQFTLTDQSEIEFEDDLSSLQEVAEAVEAGMPVEAEGDFYIDIETGNRIVKEVEFEFDFDEFDEHIISVNIEENTFTLEDGKVVQITENTLIDDDGDFFTLEEVAEALDDGEEVGAEGEFYYDPLTGFWIAIEVEFFD
ncbi:hypothetical protein DYD21_12790 [Rhodohalobacter sp. SW132]|uniref:DUF5666 domain-containing protein n=1 Tax=Rhodohalobacter sp. SW132 TaxID=2293433 RepID=UPI000E23D96D|nr:DUF5666 domain-containing protein [Rhodohalobacter sp. SW132]REL33128.1 hypothetical protein DYD21_12790 [Rhodohalobacter sp. SW132]